VRRVELSKSRLWRRDATQVVRDCPGQPLKWLTAIFLVVILEGAVRKWVLPTSLQGFAFVAKDVLVLCFCLCHPLDQRFRLLRRLRAIWLFLAVLLLPSFILGSTDSLLSAIVVYKNAILWPISALHLAARVSERDVRAFSRLVALATTLMAALAIGQYRSAPDSWINRYAWDQAGVQVGVASMGDTLVGVRGTGTFSYISGLSVFAVFSFNLMIWTITIAQNTKERAFAALGLTMALCCGAASGSRTALAYSALTTIAVLVMAPNFARNLRVISGVGISLAIFALVVAPDAALSYYQRVTNPGDDAIKRITSEDLKGNYLEILNSSPFGIGLGQSTGVAAFERSKATNTVSVVYDHRPSNAVLEGGVLAFIALGVSNIVCIWLVAMGLNTKSRGLRVCTATLGGSSLFAVAGCLWYDHNATSMYWILLAFWLSFMSTRPHFGPRHLANVSPRYQDDQAAALSA